VCHKTIKICYNLADVRADEQPEETCIDNLAGIAVLIKVFEVIVESLLDEYSSADHVK
jgi:hypothetical protein